MAPRRWSFLIPILLFAATMGLLQWLVLFALRLPFEPVHGLMLAWFTLLAIGLHLWQEHAMAADPKGFARRFMAGLGIKMLLSLGMLVLVLLRSPKESVLTAGITFAALYLAYLAFSTVRLSGLSRRLPRT
jgi:hypothetical protein